MPTACAEVGVGARCRRLVSPDALALWLIDLIIAPDVRAAGHLADEEWRRAARFRHAADRRRYIAAHAAVRGLIEEQCGLPIEAQRFDRTALGKWRLVGAPDWRFNLSYSGEHALIGIANRRGVGVDIEAHRHIPDAHALAGSHFTPAERAALARTPAAECDTAFLRGWTRKEACIKALGVGLGGPLTELETGIDEEDRATCYRGAHITVACVAVTDGMVGAWAMMPLDAAGQ